jgi:hypothetical protein
MLAVLTALVGCGSAESKQLTAFVARAAKLCPEATRGFGNGRAEYTDPVAVKEMVALVHANKNLPVVRTFLAYSKERKRLRTEAAALERVTPPAQVPNSRLPKLFRRQRAIYEAERRLPGIGSCAEAP